MWIIDVLDADRLLIHSLKPDFTIVRREEPKKTLWAT